MKFEQHPASQETPEEKPRSGKLKKSAVILGMIGAITGGLGSEARADAKKSRESEAEKKMSDLERLSAEADARWERPHGGIATIESRSEAVGPDGRIVLFYGGIGDVNASGDAEHVRGYSILDLGDPAKTGDEHWIDIRRGEYAGGKTDPEYASSLEVSSDGSDFYLDTPFGHELAGKEEIVEKGVVARLSFLAATKAYWEFYAAKVTGQDEKSVKKALQDVLSNGGEFLGEIAGSGKDFDDTTRIHEEIKARANAKLKIIEDFVPDVKKR